MLKVFELTKVEAGPAVLIPWIAFNLYAILYPFLASIKCNELLCSDTSEEEDEMRIEESNEETASYLVSYFF